MHTGAKHLTEGDAKIKEKGAQLWAPASEMEGLLEPALDGHKILSRFSDTINGTYAEILKERIKNQEKIILQMEGKVSGER